MKVSTVFVSFCLPWRLYYYRSFFINQGNINFVYFGGFPFIPTQPQMVCLLCLLACLFYARFMNHSDCGGQSDSAHRKHSSNKVLLHKSELLWLWVGWFIDTQILLYSHSLYLVHYTLNRWLSIHVLRLMIYKGFQVFRFTEYYLSILLFRGFTPSRSSI